MIQSIEDQMFNYALTEYDRELKELKYKVDHTLRTNPHNKYEGTAVEYIRDYRLHLSLWRDISRQYCNNKPIPEHLKTLS